MLNAFHYQQILSQIIKHTDREILQSIPEIRTMVQCSLVLIQAYVAHLKVTKHWWDFCLKKPFSSAEKCFNGLISKLIPECLDVVIETVMNFFKIERLWKVEFICCEILVSLLSCKASPDYLMSKILDYLEETLNKNDAKEARHVMSVLYNILYEDFWKKHGLNDLLRLMKLYHTSVHETLTDDNQYYQLRRGFEMCLRRLFEIIENSELSNVITVMMNLCFDSELTKEAMFDFGSTVEYAACCYKTDFITVTIEPKNFEFLLNGIGSENSNRSILSCRILSRLLDRHNNYSEFNTPIIFFNDTTYNIQVGIMDNVNASEKNFIKNFRELIQEKLHTAIIHHSHIRVNLESIYTVICLIAAEVPCGYTSALLVTVSLQIQQYVINNFNRITMTHSNQLHAMVLSIMTLLCWITRSKSFSDYIDIIVKRRCDEAPHLNPPLKVSYQYAQHHVRWNKDTLLFDPWELRYGLWKRFRCNEEVLSIDGRSSLVYNVNKRLLSEQRWIE